MKRLTKDDLWEIYKKNIAGSTKYINVDHYCCYPIVIEDENEIYFSKKWGINSDDELIYNFEKNWFINLQMYEQNKSFCLHIYGKEKIVND
ncbi:MAG: hypothetical protein HXM12_00155 [Fusobacterium periodonticum]|nr:hypothetical protein [Fusobacterium periodonticum]